MNYLMHLNKIQVKRHIIIWSLIILYFVIDNFVLGNFIKGSLIARIVGETLDDVGYILIFYFISLFIFPKYWESKRRFLLFMNIFLSYVIFSLLTYINYFIVIPYSGGHVFYQDHPISYLLMENIFYFFIVGSAAIASFSYRFSIHKLETQTEKEKMLLVQELNFLKNQFNSQITFDFLNHCYNQVINFSGEVAEAFKYFSEILRYTMQTKPEEKVDISKEINYILNYINLQKLLSTKVYAILNIEGEKTGNLILPRILITFVENAFKHGIFNNPSFPILIDIKITNKNINFSVKNKINPHRLTKSTSTGLVNVKKILYLHYKNNFELKQKEDNDYYAITLNLVI